MVHRCGHRGRYTIEPEVGGEGSGRTNRGDGSLEHGLHGGGQRGLLEREDLAVVEVTEARHGREGAEAIARVVRAAAAILPGLLSAHLDVGLDVRGWQHTHIDDSAGAGLHRHCITMKRARVPEGDVTGANIDDERALKEGVLLLLLAEFIPVVVWLEDRQQPTRLEVLAVYQVALWEHHQPPEQHTRTGFLGTGRVIVYLTGFR